MSDSYLVKEIGYSLAAAACPVVMCGVVPKVARELLAPSSFDRTFSTLAGIAEWKDVLDSMIGADFEDPRY